MIKVFVIICKHLHHCGYILVVANLRNPLQTNKHDKRGDFR